MFSLGVFSGVVRAVGGIGPVGGVCFFVIFFVCCFQLRECGILGALGIDYVLNLY